MSEEKTVVQTISNSGFSLKGLQGEHMGSVYPIHSVFRVGREQDNDLIINEGFVSRYHAQLKLIAGELLLTDNESANGTWVNKRLIQSTTVISVGDIVKFDVIEFAVEQYVSAEACFSTIPDETNSRLQRVNADFDNRATIVELVNQRLVSSPALPIRPSFPAASTEKTAMLAVPIEPARVEVGPSAAAAMKKVDAISAAEIELLGVTAPIANRRYKLNKNLHMIGRSPFNDIILKSSSVSSMHAEIEKIGDHWHLRDLDSSNGTYVNDELIDECEIYHNDCLLFGEVVLTFDPKGVVPAPKRVKKQTKLSQLNSSSSMWVLIATLLLVCIVMVLFYI